MRKPHFDAKDGDDHVLWSDITHNRTPLQELDRYLAWMDISLALDNNKGGYSVAVQYHNDEAVNRFLDWCQVKWNRQAMLIGAED